MTNPAHESPVPSSEPGQPMPTGDAFIDEYFNQALVSSETKGDDQAMETTAVDPHGVERR